MRVSERNKLNKKKGCVGECVRVSGRGQKEEEEKEEEETEREGHRSV